MPDNKKHQPNRIPFESIETLERWPLPRMGEGQKPVSFGKKASSPKAEEKSKERIEDVTEPVSHKPLTAEQLNEITEAAEKEGYAAGYEKGLAEGLEQGQQKGEEQGRQQAYQATYKALEEERSRLYQIADALMAPVDEQDQALERMIVDIAVGLSKHLLQQELKADTSALYGVVQQAISALPMGAASVRVYLNPEDLAAAEQLFENDKSRGWQFLADAKLHRGGCRVESADSVVDFSVERRLRDYLEAVAHGGDIEAARVAPVEDYRPDSPELASGVTAEPSQLQEPQSQEPKPQEQQPESEQDLSEPDPSETDPQHD